MVKLQFPGERGTDTDVASYAEDLGKLRRSALSGSDAITFIREIAAGLDGES